MTKSSIREQIKAARRSIRTWPEWLVPEYIKKQRWYRRNDAP